MREGAGYTTPLVSGSRRFAGGFLLTVLVGMKYRVFEGGDPIPIRAVRRYR